MHCLNSTIATILLTLAAPAAMAQDLLRIGYFDIPPHVTGVEEGQPRGAAISYFEKHVAPHFDVPFVWDTEVTAPTAYPCSWAKWPTV